MPFLAGWYAPVEIVLQPARRSIAYERGAGIGNASGLGVSCIRHSMHAATPVFDGISEAKYLGDT